MRRQDPDSVFQPAKTDGFVAGLVDMHFDEATCEHARKPEFPPLTEERKRDLLEFHHRFGKK